MSDLSPHLFWDVDSTTIDYEKHARWLVRRVLGYGLWADWQALVNYYGKERLRELAFSSLSQLDPRSAAFCRAWFSEPALEEASPSESPRLDFLRK